MEVLALALGRAHSAERSGSRTFAGGSRAAHGAGRGLRLRPGATAFLFSSLSLSLTPLQDGGKRNSCTGLRRPRNVTHSV